MIGVAILMFMRRKSTSESSLPSNRYQYHSLTVLSYLSLLCVMGKGSSVNKRVLIDYNVDILREALLDVFRV